MWREHTSSAYDKKQRQGTYGKSRLDGVGRHKPFEICQTQNALSLVAHSSGRRDFSWFSHKPDISGSGSQEEQEQLGSTLVTPRTNGVKIKNKKNMTYTVV